MRFLDFSKPFCLAAASTLTIWWGLFGAESFAGDWLTGGAFRDRLEDRVGLSWSNAPLRESLQKLGRTKHVAVLVDRRVDPGQRVSLSVDGVPLIDAVFELARQRDLEACLFGPVVYITPPETGERLRTLAAVKTETLRKLPVDRRLRWMKAEPLKWPDFAVPRELVLELARSSGISIEGIKRIPHDLWAAADLPPMSLSDRLTLLLGQFDLTYKPGPGADEVRLAPLPEEIGLVRSYMVRGATEPAVKQYSAAAPGAEFKVVGNKVYVRGLLADHERIAALRSDGTRQPRSRRPTSSREPKDDLSARRFTIREAKGTARQILEHLARELELKLQIDPADSNKIDTALETYVEVSVNQATLDRLLAAVFEPTNLEFQRNGKTIAIRLP